MVSKIEYDDHPEELMNTETKLEPCPFEGCETYVCLVPPVVGEYPRGETWRASCLRGHFSCDFTNKESAVAFANRRAPAPEARLSEEAKDHLETAKIWEDREPDRFGCSDHIASLRFFAREYLRLLAEQRT